MMQCPVCDANIESSVCAECGFDPSCSFEAYPTLAPLPDSQDAISRLRAQLQAAQGNLFHCPVCGGKTFWINFEEGRIQCTACRAFHPIQAQPSSNAEAEEIPAEPLFPIPDLAPSLVAMGEHHTVILRSDGTVRSVGNNAYERCNIGDWTQVTAICAGYSHTVGLRRDGRVHAVGDNRCGQCLIQDWTNIAAIAAGYSHTLGLRKDGTVVAIGDNADKQCDVGNWKHIQAIAAAGNVSVGLRSDGTVVNTCPSRFPTEEWNGIIALAVSPNHLVGLRGDGTVAAAGHPSFVQSDIEKWTDVVAIATSTSHTVALRADGTVYSTPIGTFFTGSDPTSWRNVISVAVGDNFTVGLRSDGTVAFNGSKRWMKQETGTWTEISQIFTSSDRIVGIRRDGTLVAVGYNEYGQCDVEGISIFKTTNWSGGSL